MFEQLKGNVSTFESHLSSAFTKVEHSIAALRDEVDKLDKTLLLPLERLKGVITKVHGAVEQEISKVRHEIKELAPPK